jgi:hypothetical protein
MKTIRKTAIEIIDWLLQDFDFIGCVNFVDAFADLIDLMI